MSEMMQAEETLSPAGISKWKPYPVYKDSGVEWLGEIPEHWEVRRLKYIADYVSRGNSPDYVEESKVKVINQACIQWDGFHPENVKYQLDQDISEWKGRLLSGDLLINSTGTGTLGRSVVFKGEGTNIADGHVTIVRFNHSQIIVEYVFYLIRSPLYQGYIYSALIAGSTNQIELSREGLRDMNILLPPLPEQRAIAVFLDRESAHIDALVAKKERLVKLLLEKRAALISHAVTKGLDAGVRMRDSGVEWLGEIPEHWEVRRLKFVADVLNGVAKGRDLGQREVVELPYLRVANVQDGYLDLSDIATITVGVDEIDRYSLQPGDVLMNEGGDFDKLGRGYVWNGEISPCLHQNHVFAVRPQSGINPYWISLITLTGYAKHYFILKSKQSTNLASISATNLKELPVLMPPDVECDEILAYIRNITAKIDALITRIREGIEKLQEYRVALIAAVVTGKIDVMNLGFESRGL